jgi:adenosylcobinamide kinase/adenosylcobinamide-phosphate guanylyltransferase
MDERRISLVGGGVRSGKSRFAVELGLKLGARRTFVATATPSDAEMRVRIDRHKLDRGAAFETIEEPVALADVLGRLSCDVVVVDCVTHWLSNLLLRRLGHDAILDDVDRVSAALASRRFHSILVTNEVGMSIHPATELGRAFVDVVGFANQRLAAVADDLYFATMGVVMKMNPVVLAEHLGGPS